MFQQRLIIIAIIQFIFIVSKCINYHSFMPEEQLGDLSPIQQQKKKTKQKIKYLCYWIIILFLCYVIFRIYVPDYSDKKYVTMEYNIPIVFIWIGGQIPSRYEYRLKWITFPYILIGQKQWQQLGKQFHGYSLHPLFKGDILRLLYLYENPGVYSDLDMILDYKCLMRMLARKKGFYMAGQPMYNWPYVSNYLLYVDNKHDPTIKKILQAIKYTLETRKVFSYYDVADITGSNLIMRNGAKKIDDIYLCIDHQQKQDII